MYVIIVIGRSSLTVFCLLELGDRQPGVFGPGKIDYSIFERQFG
jgi:hypothetical protein